MKKIFHKLSKNYNSLSIAVKAGFWFTFCNLVLKGISFITVPLFSRLLPSSEYGLLSVYMSFEQVILTLATWEISLSAYQRGIFKYKDDIMFFTVSTQLFSQVITFIFFGIIFLIWPMFLDFTKLSLNNTLLLMIYMLMQPAYSCWIIEKRTKFEYRKAVLVTILFSIVNVIIPMAAILFIAKTANIKFKFTLIASICVYLVFYIRNSNYRILVGNTDLVMQQWKFIAAYQIPIIFHALSYTILAQADRIMIGKMVGDSQAGYYSIAYSIANIASIFQNSVNQTLVPWRFDKLEKKKYSDIRRSTPYLLAGAAILILAFIFISPEIIKFLFTQDYYEAVWSIPPIAISVYFMFLYTMFVLVENYYEKTVYVAIVSVTCAVINIVLNYILIGVFGYIVCGYTTVVSYMLFSLGHYFFMKKTCHEAGITEEIYDIQHIIVISLILIAASIVITFLYPYTVLRYSILICAIMICIINKNKILSIVSSFRKTNNLGGTK